MVAGSLCSTSVDMRVTAGLAYRSAAAGVLAAALAALHPSLAVAACWQYRVDVPRGPNKEGQPQPPGHAYLWVPPAAAALRGLLVGGRLGIELELAHDPEVRRACAANAIGILYFDPHVSATFTYWKDDSAERFLKALDAVAAGANRPEVRRVPWITMGHSTAGIFCRNVAYWKPGRTAGVLHIKSGNFHQKDITPPDGSLAGVPLVAINGQLESFGPEGGLRPELGRETQWVFVLKDVQAFRQRDPQHLLSVLVQPGDDHFHGAPELGAYAALFIGKTARYRLPVSLPAGDAPVACLPLRAEDGWLTDPELKRPARAAAAFAGYAGDKALALWHYDREMAAANMAFHTNMANDQVLGNPECAWLDEGDGWVFGATTRFLDAMPEKFGGALANKAVGHAATPPVLRCKNTEPIEQIAPDRFRALRLPAGRNAAFNICAYHPGDKAFRATYRWGSLAVPQIKGRPQTIAFPEVPDLRSDAKPVALKAVSDSGLPVHYEVDCGPIAVRDGQVCVDELPPNPRYPLTCAVTAYQIGRRIGDPVTPAAPVTRTFRVVGR